MAFKFKLNNHVEDKVTGFSGIILARSEYSTGCLQYGVTPTDLNKDGDLKEWQWFDESRLKEINKKTIQGLKSKGGPAPKAPTIN